MAVLVFAFADVQRRCSPRLTEELVRALPASRRFPIAVPAVHDEFIRLPAFALGVFVQPVFFQPPRSRALTFGAFVIHQKDVPKFSQTAVSVLQDTGAVWLPAKN